MKVEINDLFRLKRRGYTFPAAVILWYLFAQERAAEAEHLVILDEERWKFCLTITELAETVGMTQPNMTHMVKKLSGKNLVRLMPVPWNNVQKRVGLTKEGRRMLENVFWGI